MVWMIHHLPRDASQALTEVELAIARGLALRTGQIRDAGGLFQVREGRGQSSLRLYPRALSCPRWTSEKRTPARGMTPGFSNRRSRMGGTYPVALLRKRQAMMRVPCFMILGRGGARNFLIPHPDVHTRGSPLFPRRQSAAASMAPRSSSLIAFRDRMASGVNRSKDRQLRRITG